MRMDREVHVKSVSHVTLMHSVKQLRHFRSYVINNRGSFEMWCWIRMERSCEKWRSVTVSEDRTFLHTTKRRKANWIGSILRRYCLIKHVIEGESSCWMTLRKWEFTGGWNRKHAMELSGEVYVRVYGLVVRQTALGWLWCWWRLWWWGGGGGGWQRTYNSFVLLTFIKHSNATVTIQLHSLSLLQWFLHTVEDVGGN
jgi:hypothetical protein